MNSQRTVPTSALPILPDAHLALPEFKTAKEADDATEAFNHKVELLRHELLDLFLRNAHGVLGYASFDAYCVERLNIVMDSGNLTHLRQWAQVERSIAINNVSNCTMVQLETGQWIVKLPRATACELAKLPSPDLQRTVFNQIKTIEGHGHGTPRQYHNDLKKIVAQMLTKNAPAKPLNQTEVNPAENIAAQTTGRAEALAASQQKHTPAFTSAMSGFSPPPDAPASDEEAEQEIDFTNALEHLRTVQTWCEAQSVDGSPRTRRQVAECLRKLSVWIEA